MKVYHNEPLVQDLDCDASIVSPLNHHSLSLSSPTLQWEGSPLLGSVHLHMQENPTEICSEYWISICQRGCILGSCWMDSVTHRMCIFCPLALAAVTSPQNLSHGPSELWQYWLTEAPLFLETRRNVKACGKRFISDVPVLLSAKKHCSENVRIIMIGYPPFFWPMSTLPRSHHGYIVTSTHRWNRASPRHLGIDYLVIFTRIPKHCQ